MKRFVVIAALFVTIPHAYSTQAISTLEGVVVEVGTDRPIEGVSVSLLTDARLPILTFSVDPNLKTASTDTQGHFTLVGIEPGYYRVMPERTGFVFAPGTSVKAPREPGVRVRVSPGSPITGLRVPMAGDAVITGRMLDSKGQPAPGNASTVALVRYTYDDSGQRQLGWVPGIKYPGVAGSFVRMNDLGEYRFYGVPPGDYYIQVTGGPRGGLPPKLPVVSYYPGTTDESKAERIHVSSGDEISLGTMTFQQADASKVHLRFEGGDGQSAASFTLNLGNQDAIMGSSAQAGTNLTLRQGHYTGRASTNTSYAEMNFDVGSADVEQVVKMTPGVRVHVNIFKEGESGQRTPYRPAPSEFRCNWRAEPAKLASLCISSRAGGFYLGSTGISSFSGEPQAIPTGTFRLEFPQLPPDMFVRTVEVSSHDFHREPLAVDHDTDIAVVLSSTHALIRGSVRDADGGKLPDAIVVLIPDGTLRSVGDLYREVLADRNGDFEIHGIAPGNYHVFAWPDLEGNAYRNAEFMKMYEDGGIPVKLETESQISQDIKAF